VQGNWEVHEAFWALLRAYDPDEIALFQHSPRAFQMADRWGFDRWLDEQAAKNSSPTGQAPAEIRRQLLEPSQLNSRLGPRPVPEELQSRTHSQLALTRQDGPIVRSSLLADRGPEGNLTDLLNLTSVPDAAQVLDLDHWGPAVALLIESRLGRLSPSHEQALSAKGTTVQRPTVDAEDLPWLLDLAWTGSVHWIHKLGGADVKSNFDYASCPLPLSAYGCLWFRRLSAPSSVGLVVIGDSPVDFTFATTRDRVSGRTFWLPYREATAEDAVASTLLSSLGRALRNSDYPTEDQTAQATSLSLTVPELDPVIALIPQGLRTQNLAFEVVEPADLLHPRR